MIESGKNIIKDIRMKLKLKKEIWENEFPKEHKQKIIFVIGTGRSGTHWLGYILQRHKLMKATIEDEVIFSLIKKMALDVTRKDALMPKLLKMYKKQLKKFYPFHYVDKSHPNIWFVEDLMMEFPTACFIGIIRNPYGVVASMLRHKGVLEWHKTWKKYPIPNQFLGITDAKKYQKLSLASQCTLRWVAHYQRMMELKNRCKKNLIVLSYDNLIAEPIRELRKIQKFLNVEASFDPGEIKNESLNKWEWRLSKEEKNDIGNLLKSYALPLKLQNIQ